MVRCIGLVIGLLMSISFFGFLGFMTIDREQARQDYLKIKSGEVEYNKVIDCIYQPNCDYYNKLLEADND